MLHRMVYLEKDLALKDSGELTVNINVRDPITMLWVEVRNINGATSNKHNPLHKSITEIQLIDGSDVIYSLDGYQAWAMACYDLGFAPEQAFSALGGDFQAMRIPILFGRWLNDIQLSLDPSRFRNLQLRIKYDFGTAAATTWVTISGTLTVIAEVMEGAPAPSSLLLKKEQYTWTSAVGTEYIDVPTNHVLKGLMYRSHLDAYHPYGIVSTLRMTVDAGKIMPIDGDVEDILWLQSLHQSRFSYRISDYLVNGNTFYSYLEEKEDVSMNAESALDTVASYFNYEYGSRLAHVYTAGAVSAGTNVGAHVHGYCPFGYIYLPLGEQTEPIDWFPARNFGSIRLEAKGIVASGECALVTVQERPY